MPQRQWMNSPASVGLTCGALYHSISTDKKGLLACGGRADRSAEMAANAKAIAAAAEDDWERLLAEGIAYIKMALVPEVQRIVLLDGPSCSGRSGAMAQPEQLP